MQGRTEQIAAEIAGFGNYKTYRQAKKIVKEGIPQLIKAVEEGLPILRAFKICCFLPERQRYFLSLDRLTMIQELHESCLQNSPNKWAKICNPNGLKKNDESDYESTAAWALLSFSASGIFVKKRKRSEEEEKVKTDYHYHKVKI